MSTVDHMSDVAEAMAVPTEPIWRLSVRNYHEMIRTGILADDDPVELLNGWLVTKMPKKPAHSLCTQLTSEILTRIVPDDWHVNVQEPITTDDSEPEPDITIVRGSRRDYRDRHPRPADVSLVVEIADTTLDRDRGRKKRLYAQESISIYWIVDLNSRRVEAYSKPSGHDAHPDYGSCEVCGDNDQIAVIIDGKEIAKVRVRELLP